MVSRYLNNFHMRSSQAIFFCLALLGAALSGCVRREFIPKPPDYRQDLMWYIVKADSCGAGIYTGAESGADVFYAVSTWELDWVTLQGDTCHYADVWNPTHRERMSRELKKAASYMTLGTSLPSQSPDAGIKEFRINNFYAPYYRHITFENWVTRDEALIHRRAQVAMDDIKAAYDEFQRRRDRERPFILAGFSQGGMAVVELLKYMKEADYRQLVAAYVLGYQVTADDTLSCPRIRPAHGADDLGVTICYNTVKDTAYVIRGICDNCALCINPVNWRTDDTPAILHDTITVAVSPEKHVLVVQNYAATEYPPVMGFINVGDIHSCEPWLYSDCLRCNFALRTAHWYSLRD